jgi:hypothetical protein
MWRKLRGMVEPVSPLHLSSTILNRLYVLRASVTAPAPWLAQRQQDPGRFRDV